MSDSATAVLALVIAGAHVALFVVAYLWSLRSRHLGFLALIVPAAVAWSLAGFPLVRALTYGTRRFGVPRTGLQVAGLAAIVLAFGAFFACAVGSLVGLVRPRKMQGRPAVKEGAWTSGNSSRSRP